ncbi:MAG: ATP cone domain-containing protein, partial [Patescibacteria group bacterium]
MIAKKKKTQKTPRLTGAGFKFIKKRDGRIMPFDVKMIADAVYKASSAVGAPDRKLADELAREVLARLWKKITGRGAIPTVEGVQDMVEQVLIDAGRAKIAKAYILYRERRAEIRQEKKQILNKEEIDEVDKHFDLNALRVLAARYLRKDDTGKIIESPKELFIRVAVHTTLPSLFYDHRVYDGRGGEEEHRPEEFEPEKFEGKFSIGRYKLNRFHLEALKRLFDHFNEKRRMKVSWSHLLEMLKKHQFADYEKEAERYYNLMASRRFMPNTPALANFGSFLGMGSACFVLGLEDSIDSIMDKLKAASIIFKAGGGVGYNFSSLRPEGDYIKSTGGAASGPISFMTMFDNMTDVIKQGGIRRGANMGILNTNHPDIEKFIKAKEGNLALKNFNISVLVMPDFFEHYRKNQPYPLVNPRTGKIVRHVDPRKLFDLIAYQAWESAEPGVIFHDRINEYNPFSEHLGPIVTTNPCGEVLLYPYESCNLGSINVWSFVRENANGKKRFAWDELAETVKTAVFLLDNVIDVNKYPLPEIKEMTMSTR